MSELIPYERIENKIFLMRGKKVMLSLHLAELYGVEHKVLMQSVKRNLNRFPEDFMFALNNKEFTILKSQIVTSSWGGHRKPPHAFTEQGVAMLSSVLRSDRAVQVNIQIMRAFVKIRELLLSHQDLLKKVEEMEKKYDKQFLVVFEAIKKLMTPIESKPKGKIGFNADNNH